GTAADDRPHRPGRHDPRRGREGAGAHPRARAMRHPRPSAVSVGWAVPTVRKSGGHCPPYKPLVRSSVADHYLTPGGKRTRTFSQGRTVISTQLMMSWGDNVGFLSLPILACNVCLKIFSLQCWQKAMRNF